MMYDSWGWGWGGWLLMTLVMIVFWAAVITAVVLAVRYVAGSRHPGATPGPSGPARAEDLLAERFARGEIDDDEIDSALPCCANTVDLDDFPQFAARAGRRDCIHRARDCVHGRFGQRRTGQPTPAFLDRAIVV